MKPLRRLVVPAVLSVVAIGGPLVTTSSCERGSSSSVDARASNEGEPPNDATMPVVDGGTDAIADAATSDVAAVDAAPDSPPIDAAPPDMPG
jgi:hypothetical protein